MRIAIFGLGYVGAVSAACFARDGHEVIGVEPNETKVGIINDGRTPIIERDMDVLISKAVAEHRLRVTTDPLEAVDNADLSLVCVGTPSNGNGSLNLRYVEAVCREIGSALRNLDAFHTVVMRSTMLPGSMQSTVIPTLERYSGKQTGLDFGVCNNPEFLREGSAVSDFYNPPKTVIGESDETSGNMLLQLYERLDAPLIRTDIETAEMVKYVDNVWHALKVGFANEIGNICKELSLDGHRVMDIFCSDTKLNLSPYYLKPGFAFGGSCLPKDVRAITHKARRLDLHLPILDAILPSNELQVGRAVEMISKAGNRKVGVLGMSFKAGTDDLRESPVIELIERLIGKGYDLRIYDRNVHMAALIGANREYILDRIPHISRFLVEDMEAVLEHAETLVIGNGSPEFADSVNRAESGRTVVDLARVDLNRRSGGNYSGICW